MLLTPALLLSLGLHALVVGLMPGFAQEPSKLADQLTVELQPPPPKPLPPPEPPKPEPEKPKEPPKKLPLPPKPLPVIQHKAETPPPVRVAETPPPTPVMAVAPKPSEPLPSFTAPAPPPEPPSKPVAAPPDLDAAYGNYGSILSREFAKHKQYPRIAQMRGWQGIARIELRIDASGNVTSSTIAESSGFEILDKQALDMVRKASPLPLPPEALRGRDFTIVVPVSFKLE
jgi:protein TonB